MAHSAELVAATATLVGKAALLALRDALYAVAASGARRKAKGAHHRLPLRAVRLEPALRIEPANRVVSHLVWHGVDQALLPIFGK